MILRWMTTGVLSMLAAVAVCAAETPSYQEIFTAGEGGYACFRIPALIRAGDGALLAFAEGRKNGCGDHGDVDLVMKRSEDLGATWGRLSLVYEEGGTAEITIGNPCPVLDRDTGTLWMPFCRDNDRVFMTQSDDHGRTWQPPVEITEEVKEPTWGWYATGPGVGIQIQQGPHAGRLVIPSNHGTRKGEPVERASHCIYSDDHGVTWKLGGPALPFTNESQVVELDDGRLMMNMRKSKGTTSRGSRAVAWSEDGGESWSAAVSDEALPCPTCQASIIADTVEGEAVLLFSNPANAKARDTLTLRLSRDGGKSWPVAKVLHAGPAAYSSLCALGDGNYGCLYEAWDDPKKRYLNLRFMRFSADGLRETAVAASSEEELSGAVNAPVPVPEPSELAVQRYKSGNMLWVVNQLWGLLIPALILFTGLSARIRDWATRIGRWWFFIIAVYFIIYSVLTWLIDLPLSYYQGYIREHAYGLSNQSFLKWFQDSALNLAVGLVMGVLFLWIPFLLLKKSPKRWWLYTALLIPPFLFFQMLVTPVFIDPLFNTFGEMKDKALEAQILALAERSGIEGSRVYEVDKSEDTNAVNAYVTGFMNTKRIVLWDTLLAKLDDDEVLFVMGHEMGHYVLGHVVRFILFISVVLLVALYLIHRLAGKLIAKYGARFRFDSLSDIAALPLILLMLNVFSLVVMPLILAVSRHHEHEADRFGLELNRGNRAAATAFVKLQEENLGVPWHGPLYKLFRDSHPPIGERITFFNEYKPWETGEPLKYGEHFGE